MRLSPLHPLLLITMTGLVPRPALPCTAFMGGQGEKLAFGRGYDWDMGQGLVVINKRGMGKVALLTTDKQKPVEWISKYGSVTFNQYGRELPNGGMNEKGLVIANLWLEETVYPQPNSRPVLNELQWIQYQLDSHASVKEVLAHLDERVILNQYGKIHFLVGDRTGACAAVEFIGGKPVVTTGKELPVCAITNTSYSASAAYLKQQGGLKQGKKASFRARSQKSRDRFVRAARGGASLDATGDLALQTFAILDGVRMHHTRWNLAYLPGELKVHFRTTASPAIKTVDLKAFDLSCATPVRILDIDTQEAGDASKRFAAYTTERNLQLIQQCTTPKLAPELMQLLAGYPAQLGCKAH